MAEQLYTIPINEAFEEYDGCPMCRLRKKLEDQSLSYIMGAAMMEPDIRMVTNKQGFCREHFHRMLGMGNRLSLALMLESHLQDLWESVPDPDGKKPGKLGKFKKYDGESQGAGLLSRAGSCYVCNRVREFEGKYVSNVVYIYKKDPSFPEKLKNQPYFCLEHAGQLLECGRQELSEEKYLTFSQDILTLTKRRLAALRQDVTTFCRSFDHENAGKPLSDQARYSVESAVAFLSGDFEK
jgi:hypothetical protein